MGWMQGQPPAPDKTVRPGDPGFFAFPRLRRTVRHFSQMMQVVGVEQGAKAAAALPEALTPRSDRSPSPKGGEQQITRNAVFESNCGGGVIVLYQAASLLNAIAAAPSPRACTPSCRSRKA